MKELKKKRLKKALEDSGNWIGILLGTLILGMLPLSISQVVLGSIRGEELFGQCFLWSFVASFIFTISFYFFIVSNDKSYDDEISKEESKKENAQEKEKDVDFKQNIQSLSLVISKLEDKQCDIIEELDRLVASILTILKNCPIDKREEHYLIHTLPLDIKKSVSIYIEMNDENQRKMKPMLLNLLEKKQRELDEKFVAVHEEAKIKEFNRQIAIAETRDF